MPETLFVIDANERHNIAFLVVFSAISAMSCICNGVIRVIDWIEREIKAAAIRTLSGFVEFNFHVPPFLQPLQLLLLSVEDS